MSVHPLNIIMREVENPQAILYRLEKDIFVFFISSIVELAEKRVGGCRHHIEAESR